ncbi:iron-containing alcohol dehydrogenase [Rhizobium sp. GN54]|uniref:iron-containing alcohol dehydrogenase n=1 Tax=Rhizobium sp. GN54 TaxID=2898150 RepID=UPI001E57DC6F|nr:iron-containing alcohol dehydrogenase [Rhizobium sp. GN54]MCD2184632.1 iron-containing alcohol dehydrogenase [Rhizobium sp. GN54]
MRLDYGVTRAPARLFFGPGQRRAIGRAAADLGRKVLVCTDARLAALPVMVEILDDLRTHGLEVAVFDATEAELPLAGIHACVEAYRDFDPDVIIGLGGGSCLDLAKLVSLSLTYPGPLSQYYGEFKVPGPVRPLIAVPTTSGTGSEATPVAVLADPERTMKVGISSPALIPHTAICDPELTVTCPRGLTAISGADALAHAIEAFAAVERPADPQLAMTRVFVGKNTLSDHYALAAIRLVFDYLERAVEQGDDIEARSAIMLAATYAGLAFGSGGTAAAHAIQYPLGALTHTAHGLGVGILLPFTMEFNLKAAGANYAEIGRAIGAASETQSDQEAAAAAIDSVRTLFARIGIPDSVGEIGVAETDLDSLSELSMGAARLVENNPARLDAAAMKTILTRALQGARG